MSNKHEFKVSLDIGLVDEWHRDTLKDIIKSATFRQRKDYPEYYVDYEDGTVENLSLSQLRDLSELFKVELKGGDCLIVSGGD